MNINIFCLYELYDDYLCIKMNYIYKACFHSYVLEGDMLKEKERYLKKIWTDVNHPTAFWGPHH
jgi:hypothetical protein